MNWQQFFDKAKRSEAERDFHSACFHISRAFMAALSIEDDPSATICDRFEKALLSAKHSFEPKSWKFYLEKSRESFACADVAAAKYQAAWAFREAMKTGDEKAAGMVEQHRQMLAPHKSKPRYPEKGWKMYLEELQDGVGGEGWQEKLEEGYVDALADYNEHAMNVLYKMLKSGKSGWVSPMANKYKDIDHWGMGLNQAREHLQNKRYEELTRECEKLLMSLPLPEPTGSQKQVMEENAARFYQQCLVKVMYIQAQIHQHRPECALPLLEDQEFRTWLKWNNDPRIRKNLSFATYYYQILPALPIPDWLKENPRIRPDGLSIVESTITATGGSELLWEEAVVDNADFYVWLPCNSTKERFGDALLEQGMDLEAQAYRIVVTSVLPNIEYVELDAAKKASIATALKNVSKYPRAVERLKLASEKIRSGLELFERDATTEEAFVHWKSVLDKQKQMLRS